MNLKWNVDLVDFLTYHDVFGSMDVVSYLFKPKQNTSVFVHSPAKEQLNCFQFRICDNIQFQIFV